jgi:rhodanese-related sulfurtransferase
MPEKAIKFGGIYLIENRMKGNMKKTLCFGAVNLIFILVCLMIAPWNTPGQSQPTVFQTTLEEADQKTPEVTTEEVRRILADKSAALIDVRSAEEYAIAHIPGSINLYEKEVEQITRAFPDKTTRLVLYCNGPFCGKSKRLSEQLINLGYRNIRRYQLGLPVWRALGNTVQTDLEGFKYVLKRDRTAVFVDARNASEFAKGSVPGAVSIQAGEAEKANEDGRLPYKDKGTRVIVFADSTEAARRVAEEIARKAYWNSSYFGGVFAELRNLRLW